MRRSAADEHGEDGSFEQALETHRAYLLKFARLQLRDRHSAEDAVQETLLAAVRYRDSYEGRASLKTWLVSILKRKVIDLIRKQLREPRPSAFEDGAALDGDEASEPFGDDGRWRHPPAAWANPEAAFEAKDFWRVFERCNEAMPAALARVFVLREIFELSTEEICKELAISPTNCHVMLYRARMRLRRCLDEEWFGGR